MVSISIPADRKTRRSFQTRPLQSSPFPSQSQGSSAPRRNNKRPRSPSNPNSSTSTPFGNAQDSVYPRNPGGPSASGLRSSPPPSSLPPSSPPAPFDGFGDDEVDDQEEDAREMGRRVGGDEDDDEEEDNGEDLFGDDMMA